MKLVRQRLSYANVTATVALFIALGGGAWALSKDSVGSRAIRKDAVRSQEIDNGKVKGKDVKPGGLDGGEIADGGIAAADLADGSVGSGEIANDAVTALKIAADAVGTRALDGGAVTSGKIAGNAVTAGKIANGAVNSSEIADGAIGKSEIAPGSVGSAEVIDASLNGGDVAANSLSGAQVDESSLLGVDAARLAGRELVSVAGSTQDVDALLLTLPALHAELRTDGSAVDDFNIVLKSDVASPFLKISLSCPVGSASGIAPGGTATGSNGTEGTMLCFAFNNADPTGPGRTTILCAHDGGNDRILCDVLREP